MKNFTTYLKTLSLFSLFLVANFANSQTPCTASFAYTNNPGGSVTFSSTSVNTTSATIYYWNIYTTPATYTTGLTTTFLFPANGIYTVSLQMVNSSPSCSSTAVQIVTVTNASCNLNANFVFNQNSGNPSVSFNNTTTGAGTGVTYLWDFGDNSTLPSVSPVHTYSAYGSYLVTLNANNNYTNACISTKTLLINYNACAGGVTFSYSATSNGSVNLFSNSPQAGPSSVYNWSFGNNTTFSAVATTSASTTYSSNGYYYVTLTMASPNCTASNGGTVVVTSTATPCNLSANFFYNGSFNNYTSGATGSTTYTWNFGDNSTGTGVSPVHTYSATGNYTVTLIANNNTSPTCTSTITNIITVTPCNLNPVISSFVYSIGNAGVVTFTSTSANTTTNTNYVWNFQGLGSSSGTNLAQTTATFNTNGYFLVSLQVINSAPSCTAASSQTINITNSSPCLLNAAFTYSQVTNGVIQFYNASTGITGGTTYTLNFGDNSTSNAPGVVHTYTANGSYTVSLFASNNTTTSCTSNNIQVITITNISPCNLSTIPFTTSQGSNGAVNFYGSSVGTVGGTSYSWNFGDASTGNVISPVHSYTSNGIYTVTFIRNNNTTPTCTSSVTQTISVCTLNPPVAGFTYSVNPNGNVIFTSNSTNTDPNTIYYWNLNSNGTYTNGPGSYTTGVNMTQASSTYTAGNYGAYLYVVNVSTGCTVTSTGYYQTFTILPPCNLTAAFTNTQGLSGAVNFNSSSTGTATGSTFNWDFGDNSTGTGATVSHTYAANGTYIATLTVNAPGFSSTCTSVSNQTITIGNICVANAGFSMVPTPTPQVWNVTLASPGNIVNAIWSWGDNSTSNSLYTTHSYSAAGSYFICLSVTVSCGSTASSCNTYAIYRGTGSSQNNDVISVEVIDPANPTAIVNYNVNQVEGSLSPNPNNGSFNLNLKGITSERAEIQIYDISSKLIYSQSVQTAHGTVSKEINLNDVPNGIYFLKANSDGNVFSKKIIIEK